jgi:shikimate dehydrogenase
MSTSRFAVIGDPISHSKSPDMHAAAYRALRLTHAYDAIRTDAAGLPGLVDALRRGVFAGLNVTLPHKTRILEYVDDVEPAAKLVGAANTLKVDSAGRICATNTDLPAIAEELRALAPEREAAVWVEQPLLVLGTGGAARSAVAAAVSILGARSVVVRGRAGQDGARALNAFATSMRESLAAAGYAADIRAEVLGASAGSCAFHAVVQTTSAELSGGGEALAASIDWSTALVSTVVLDVVYSPAESAFLRAARVAGLRSVNGIGMLARQGGLAFEYWLGQAAPYNAMLAAIV